ncbi:uncharacterized protein LOC129614007 [Condylostylus longicornis]|uniref:uncharacterized protein LOC129614007 n=1 Tax=Condylostylus longicornis TaxID=2530218 RepID=UPI00244DB841|nr:uncharacterized protein LOC129614007 [Condylostylus longicornis]
MFADGYKFWLAFKTDKTNYYRCSRYPSSKCPGRCYVDKNGKVKHTTEHNHPPEPNRLLLDKFRKSLTRRAEKETTELFKIYCDEASKHVDAALLYPFAAAESAMRKARRKQLPDCPDTVKDVVETLDHNQDLFRVHSGSDRDALYQKTISIDDCVCMIFMHRKTFDLFRGKIEELHVDGSFEFVAQNHPTYHLITFYAVLGHITAPVVYSISTAKSQAACSTIFAYLRDDLKIRPKILICDFDPILQTSLSYIYPDTVIKGCWFHYTDAVLSQMKLLKLKKETAKGIGASALKMLLVLPLLPPEYMVPGLESTRKWMEEKTIFSEGLSNLCDYVENHWLRAVGTKKMSIFGTTRISSNHLKNFNKELSNTIGQQKPVIWVILDSLTQIATKIFVKTSRKIKNFKNAAHLKTISTKDFDTSKQPTKLPAKSLKRNELISETVISRATQVWIKTPVHLRNPLVFLQLASHCINDTVYLETLSDIKERYLHPITTPPATVISNIIVSTANSNVSSSQNNAIEPISTQSIITSQTDSLTSLPTHSYSTGTWNTATHQDVLQNCDSPLQDLQNAPNSPSLSVILQENTFNCPSITHQEFLLAQPGQAPPDSQQSSYTSCFAQNRLNVDLNRTSESAIHLQQIQCDNQTQNYFTFNECHVMVSDSNVENDREACANSDQGEHSAIQQQRQNVSCLPTRHQQNEEHCKYHKETQPYKSPHNMRTNSFDIQNAQVKCISKTNNFSSKLSEPPPLVFFNSVKRLPCKRILPLLSDPPPLVPIRNNVTNSLRNKSSNYGSNLKNN